MSESNRIADQLTRSITGPAWHGPSVLELLADVTPEEALQHPIPSAHSMHEIVAHVTAWMIAADERLQGKTVELEGEADWPIPQHGQWTLSVTRLKEAEARLTARIAALSDDDLGVTLRGGGQEYSRYFLLHGVVQHNLYHAGQLALLKKAVRG